MKEIALSRGLKALVDDDDYKSLSQWTWYASIAKSPYAVRTEKRAGNRRTILMHRMLLGLGPDDALHTDHINHDTLDNRRQNLRAVTHSENQANRVSRKLGFKGVFRNHRNWRAEIRWQGQYIYLGTFPTPEEAHSVYVREGRKLHGGFFHA